MKEQYIRAKTNTHITFMYYMFVKYLFVVLYDLTPRYATQVSSQKREKSTT